MEMQLGRDIAGRQDLGGLLRRVQVPPAWPIDIGHGRDPRAAELAGRGRRSLTLSPARSQGRGRKRRASGSEHRDERQSRARHTVMNQRRRHMNQATGKITRLKRIAKTSDELTDPMGSASSGAYRAAFSERPSTFTAPRILAIRLDSAKRNKAFMP